MCMTFIASKSSQRRIHETVIGKQKKNMNGNLRKINWQNLLEESLEPAIKKYSLQRKSGNTAILYNTNCSIKFWLEDYQSLKWAFYNHNDKHVFYYDIDFYTTSILDYKTSRRFNFDKTYTLHEYTIAYLKYHNDIIVKSLNRPFTGDFSWHDKYIAKKKIYLKIVNFAHSTTNLHSQERRDLTQSFIRGEEGAKNAILEHLTKTSKNNGKEFEVLHHDISIHLIMKKFNLTVPCYFSRNNQLIKVIKRDNPKDFGQVYMLLKHEKIIITPKSCNFGAPSKFDKFEILSEHEFESKIKETLANKA